MPPNTDHHSTPDPVRVSADYVDSTSMSTTSNSSSSDNSETEVVEPRPYRSVNHFDTDKSLLEALVDNQKRSYYDGCIDSVSPNWKKPPPAPAIPDESEQEETNEDWDWVVDADKDTSYPQTVQGELNRLKVLRSYHVLDSARDESFERLTGLGSRMFDVPICLVSLIDLGRQWFLSNRGLGDARETPRKFAFCAHAILSKEDMVIVTDATKDERFCSNPLVTGPPRIRFYAGAPLISPEGYKLGTLCLIDPHTRPAGLSLDEKQNLRELAALVVDSLVKHRQSKRDSIKAKSHMIACTAHDMLTPLNGVELSLNLLLQEADLLEPSLLELVQTASSCCDIMSRTCQQAIARFRQDTPKQQQGRRPSLVHMGSESALAGYSEIVVGDLVKNLQMVMEHYPKAVPVCVSVDPSVPPVIISDDLKVFRSALNFLTNACRHTSRGSVHLQISVQEQKLVFECRDTGSGVHVELYPKLFKPMAIPKSNDLDDYEYAKACIKMDPVSKELSGGVCHPVIKSSGLGLYSVATNIRSLKGDYGYRPQTENSTSGAIFWFSIPLLTPPENSPYQNGSDQAMMEDSSNSLSTFDTSAAMNGTDASSTDTSGPQQDGADSPRVRRALVIDDSIVIRKSVSRALAKLGFVVSQAVNGMEGLKQLQQGVFDLVLCDFLMPVMDGLDCVQQYREWEKLHRPLFRQFVVGISAHASDKDIERGKAAGMDDFVAKPVTYQSLKELDESAQIHCLNKSLDSMVFTSDTMTSPFCSGNDSLLEDQAGRVLKKRKQDDMARHQQNGDQHEEDAKFVCLIAESSPDVSEFLSKCVKQVGGWKTVVVHDGQDALRLLKMRQYDAVFLNDAVPTLNATSCMERFREWEDQHRVARQGHVILLSSNYIPTSMTTIRSTTVYPDGFDGALGKPISLAELHRILQDASESVGKHDILTR